MNATTPCPDADRLRALLDDRLAAGAQAELTGHLDQCEGCQQALERLATGESRLAECLCHIGESQPAKGSAYWPARASLDQAPTVMQIDDLPTPVFQEPDLDFLDPADQPGYIGSLSHYDIIKVAGRGGMGMVLHAFDTHLHRDVALKVLDPRLAKDETARTRFCREARAAAKITHENVVTVHSVEHEEGKDLPFLVMQFVEGETLDEHLSRLGRLETREIVRIGLQMVQGLAAAHDKKLIHRDIKPGNVLLEKGTGRVKLTDFGLAHAREDARLTRSGMVTGTPLYMAPEQARGEDVDSRSDLFSLGVVLYEMATGESPFAARTPLAVLKRLTEESPRPLHDLNPDLPLWLAEVIEKLLAKNPAKRYQSAREVIEVFEPFWTMMRTKSEVCPLVVKRIRERRWRVAKLVTAAVLLAVASASFGAWMLQYLSPRDAVVAEKSRALSGVLRGNAGPVWAVAVTPKSDQLAMAIDDGTVKIWDIASETVRATLTAHKGPIWGLAISPDGMLLATGSDDTTAKIWDFATRKELFSLPHSAGIRAVAFHPAGTVLATGGRNGTVRLWNPSTGKEILSTRGHAGIVTSLAFSPDGKSLLTGSGDKTVKLWDVATGEERLSLDGHNGGIYAVAFAPNGETIAVGGWEKIIRIYEVNSGTRLASLECVNNQDVWGLAFSRDGRWLAAGHEDKQITVWDTATRKQVTTLNGHGGTVYAVAFTPDDRVLTSASRDGTAHLWVTSKIAAK